MTVRSWIFFAIWSVAVHAASSTEPTTVTIEIGDRILKYTMEKTPGEKSPARLSMEGTRQPPRQRELTLKDYDYLQRKLAGLGRGDLTAKDCPRMKAVVENRGRTSLYCLAGKAKGSARIRDLVDLLSMAL